ncbi:mitochondrial division protein [Myriangium duriaei CBS 260.36]|uniref:Mitochondrial division protein 1 n=1 Tax=Myriangium duriaei CBS 260.36 TaxID=1168546 RepID=A0A9P4J4R9_9PEZI|nr:mitochondrial division protein [Myriangium duriaei CBS 260.36]
MSVPRGRSPFRQTGPQHGATHDDEDSPIISTRQIEAFGRTLNATASQLIGGDPTQHYHNAMGEIHRELRRPIMQRSVFALAKANPRELVRSTFSTTEIQHRVLTHLPDELLKNIPDTNNSYSLFQGFEATRPEDDHKRKKKHGRHGSRGQKLLEEGKDSDRGHPGLSRLKTKKGGLDHRLEMMEARKNMCASEIVELDKKIANLAAMRKRVVERLAGLEQEETDLEHEIAEVTTKLEDLQDEVDATEAQREKTPPASAIDGQDGTSDSPTADETNFMSQSIYEKLQSPKVKKRRTPRRISMPILHEHLEPGTRIKEFQAHSDTITAMDFDVPFGTMVTAALDDTLRVWNLNTGRCTGLLEGHISSVRCVQVDDNIVASGANDATVRLWDLSQAEYTPTQSTTITRAPTVNEQDSVGGDESDLFPDATTEPDSLSARLPSSASMADCPLFTLSSHVAEVTALHFQGQTLVSGSSDKTLRQWDLNTGRCVQTLDVLWAAAQASSTASTPFASGFPSPSPSFDQTEWFRPSVGRAQTAAVEADFVGALQIFQSAVACGTADSIVRLWDLRSGNVQRQLIGHTGGVTALQFDDVHLVTGSTDRSIRIWDLRTGSIYDAFAYSAPITSMQFDLRRICAAAGEAVVKVYDKGDGHQWDCGAGAVPLRSDDAEEPPPTPSVVERVRIRDGYMVEGRKDGVVGIWAC